MRSGNRNKRWASGSLRRVSLWAPQPEPQKPQTWEDVEAWFEVLKAEVKHRDEDRATCRSQAQAELTSQKRIQLLEACQRFDEFPSDHMLQALLWLRPPTDAETRHWPQGYMNGASFLIFTGANLSGDRHVLLELSFTGEDSQVWERKNALSRDVV